MRPSAATLRRIEVGAAVTARILRLIVVSYRSQPSDFRVRIGLSDDADAGADLGQYLPSGIHQGPEVQRETRLNARPLAKSS